VVSQGSLIHSYVCQVGSSEEDQLVVGTKACRVGFSWATPLRPSREDVERDSEPKIAEDDNQHEDHEEVQTSVHEKEEKEQPTWQFDRQHGSYRLHRGTS
jgi:hypothetical protein